MEDLKKKVIQGGVAKISGQAASFALRLGYIVVMSRLLNPEDFGLMAMVTVVTGFYDLFTSAGLSSATVQRGMVTDEQISTLFWVNILVGVALCLICLGTAPALVAFYHEPRLYWLTAAMAVGFLFNAAGVQHIAILQRELRYVTLTIVELLCQLVSVGAGIGMAVAGFGYWALVAAALAGPLTMTVLAWIATAWIPGRPRRNAEILSMLHFGGIITLQSVIMHVAQNIDKLLLGRFSGAATLGTYSRAWQLINMPTTNLSSAIGWVAFSALSRLQGEPVRYRNYFLKGYKLVISTIVPLLAFCAIFADEVVFVILGPKWTDVPFLFRLLIPSALVLTIINPPTSWLLHSLGLAGRAFRIAVAYAAVIIIACIIGLPYGAPGIALALSVALSLWLVPHIMWCLHKTCVSPLDFFQATWHVLLASAVAAGLAFACANYLTDAPVLRLIVGGIVMGVAYIMMLFFAMGQKNFYLGLAKDLKLLSSAT